MRQTILITSPPVYRLANGGIEITAFSGEEEFHIQVPFEHFFAGHASAIVLLKELGENGAVPFDESKEGHG